MARPTSPTSSEGFGFTYADKVGALALLRLLSRTPFGGQDLGHVVQVQFGQRPAGWHFDDILLTLERDGQIRRLALSIKSGIHVTTAGIDSELVDQVWEQISDPGPFSESSDQLVLVHPSLSPALHSGLAELYRWARRQDDGQLPDWLKPGVSNNLKRALSKSVKKGNGKNDSQRFFRSFQFFPLDLDPPNDRHTAEAIQSCLALLARPTEAEAESLWKHLCQASADIRGSAGSCRLTDLVQLLGPHFVFREHPRTEQDLKAIHEFSKTRHLVDIRDVIGEDLRLTTEKGVEAISDGLGRGSTVFFVGSSGAGKSVVLKHFVEQCPDGELRLYFRADLASVSPTELERRLGLKHRFVECLEDSRSRIITLVVDQVDRLLTEAQIADVQELIESSKHLRPRLKFVFGCQTAEAERVLTRLSTVLTPIEVSRYYFKPDEEAMFSVVTNRYPTLRHLVFRPELRHVLLTPKNLDLLVGRLNDLGKLSNKNIISQKQFIDWFWDKYVLEGEDGIATARAMRQIAEMQADLMTPLVLPSDFPNDGPLDLLSRKQLISGDDLGITFKHDSFGDWARLRSIDAAAKSLLTFFAERGKNPLWLRALRLWSAILLETKGAEAWVQTLNQFTGEGAVPWLIRDALLDGLATAAGSYEYLTQLKSVLFESQGALLNRFLARFLFATSSPNETVAKALAEGNPLSLATYRAEFRVPHWHLWGPVVHFITVNPEQCRKLAPSLITEIIQTWLKSIPSGIQYTKELAGLAVEIASDHIAIERRRGGDSKDDYSVFHSLCMALRHCPNTAPEIILKAIGRIGEDPPPESKVNNRKRSINALSYITGQADIVEAWPDGPVTRPNEGFRQFILMGGGLRELHSFSPNFAKEVILAASIREPHIKQADHWFPSPDAELSICDDKRFYPPFHNAGLFGYIFNLDPEWALDLVLSLVTFAVSRRCEELEAQGHCVTFQLLVNGEIRQILGDRDSMGWHRASIRSPELVTCALMSLEKWLYDLIDKNEEKPIINKLVDELQLAPVVGVLLTIGKKHSELFQNHLRFLHFSETVHSTDIDLVVGNEDHQMISWAGKSEAEVNEALKWHAMPHRKQVLKSYAFLALNLPEGRIEASSACERWRMLAIESGTEVQGQFENLIAIYTIENYSFRHEKDQFLVEFVQPEKMEQAFQEFQTQSSHALAPLMLINSSRKALDQIRKLSVQEANDLYQKSRQLEVDVIERDPVISKKDALVGVASVLKLRAAEFLGQYPEALAWAEKMIVQTCLQPPEPWSMDNNRSASDDRWCHFAARALPSICATDPLNRTLRRALASIIEEGHYKATGLLAAAVYDIRLSAPDLYDQTVNLLRYWSIETIRRHEVETVKQFPKLKMTSSKWPDYPLMRKRFIENKLATKRVQLPEPVAIHEDREIPSYRSHDRPRARPLADTDRLFYFVANLPWNPLPDDGESRAELISQWNDLFIILVSELTNCHDTQGSGRSVQQYQREWEFFRYCGQLAVCASTDSPMRSWSHHIVELLPYAEHITKEFFHGVFIQLLADDAPRADVVGRWQELVETVLGSRIPEATDWSRDHGLHNWRHWLVGNDALLRKFSWKASHASFIESHVQLYESWTRRMCRSSDDFMNMLAFLKMPASREIRSRACIWIDECLSGVLPRGHEDEVYTSLADFLALARSQVTEDRYSLPQAFDAFVNLTAMLNVKNNKVAMQLFEDVATMG